MKKIAFKNFRRFEDFPSLELGNISILVGRNNSGKSTMVKAILLVLDYLQNQQYDEFSFTNKSLEDANIVTFGRAKNNKSRNDEITFSLEFESYQISIFIYGNDDDTNANVGKINIFDNNLKIYFEINYTQNIIRITKRNSRVIDTDLESFKSLKNELYDLEIEIQKKDFNKKSNIGLRILDRYNNLIEKYNHYTKIFEKERGNESDLFDKQYTLKSNANFNKTEDTIFQELISDFIFMNDAELRKLKEIRNKYAHDNTKNETLQKSDENLLNDDIIVDEEKFSFDEIEEKIQQLVDIDNYKSDLKKSINNFVHTTKELNIYYLGANPSKQNALFSIRDKQNNLAQAINDFAQSKIIKGDIEYNFVLRWMKEFEVGDYFEIKFYAGEAYEFYVYDKDDYKAHLADKGMGSLQAMMMILKIATIMRKHKSKLEFITIIVEEPELNLHPALQSKLASLFHYVNTEFKIKFIIETHSEYLIRKAQLFVAENEYTSQKGLNPNPFSVNYFDVENGPYKMNFNNNGKFDRNFGEGFYDEAAKNTMALIQKQRKQD